jgi:hypothetical protein
LACALYGIRVSDNNWRLLIADESPQALNLADRLSAALARKETVLVSAERDTLLRGIPKKPPSGLALSR